MKRELHYNTLRDLDVFVSAGRSRAWRWLEIRESVYLFPNLGQAVAVNAQVPLAEVTERCCPDCISVFAETLRDSFDESFGEIRGGSLAAQVGKGVDDDILEVSFVGKPLDVL